MTKEQFDQKLTELIDTPEKHTTISHDVFSECQRLVNSGGIDLDAFEDTYEAAKIVLSVALKNLAYQWRPLSKEGKKIADNLEHF